MEHVVFFPAHDGTPAFRRVGTLEDAVRLVEHLRNVEGVSELSVHALTEVPLAFKTLYRVEIPEAAAAPAPAPIVEVPAVETPSVEVPAVEVPSVEADVEAPVVEVPTQDVPPPLPVAEDVPPVEAPVEEEPVPALATGEAAPSSLGFFAS